MKKMNKILFALVVALTTLTLGNNSVAAAVSAPSTIKMQEQGHHFKQWGDVRGFYFKNTTIGSKKNVVSYCTNYNYTVPNGGTKLERTSELDAGFAYIIANGYPNKKWFNNSYKDYYTTQLAIWYYNDGRTDIDFSKFTVVNSTSVKTNGTWDLATIKKIQSYAKDLSSKAASAKKAGYTKPSIKINDNITFSLSSDGKYYVSNKITVKATSVPGKYTVKLSGAPSGTVVTNTSGTKATQFKTTDKFIIKVPADQVSSSIKITAQVTATGEINKAYNYKYNNNSKKWQKIMPAVLYPVTSLVSAKKVGTATPKQYNINVIKRDTATGKALAGATMVLKNKKGDIVDTWVSTTGTHTISGLLAGTYTLSETKAPEGYNLNTTVEKITVSGTTTVTKEFFNTPKPVTYTINVTKKDIETKEELKGATLVIKQGNVVKKECVMTDTATCSLSGLSAGEYTISETKAPEGYKLSTEIKTITLSGATTTKNVDFYNTKEPTTGVVKISKQDITTKTELPGATLVVKDLSGNEIERWVSSEEDHYITLEAGIYTLTEIQAPEGYVLSTETITFEVKNDGSVTSVTMYNEKYVPEPEPEPIPEPEPEEEVVSVPKTGVNDIAQYLFSGLTSLLGLGLMYKDKFSK